MIRACSTLRTSSALAGSIGRVVMMERQAITRAEFEGLARRISKLEALGPVIALITGVVGALMGYFIAHLYGLK